MGTSQERPDGRGIALQLSRGGRTVICFPLRTGGRRGVRPQRRRPAPAQGDRVALPDPTRRVVHQPVVEVMQISREPTVSARLGPLEREAALARMAEEVFDVVVVAAG
jgi:uncharacterized membrane protein